MDAWGQCAKPSLELGLELGLGLHCYLLFSILKDGRLLHQNPCRHRRPLCHHLRRLRLRLRLRLLAGFSF